MKKIFNTAEITIVGIRHSDIIVTSFDNEALGLHGYDNEYDGEEGTILF